MIATDWTLARSGWDRVGGQVNIFVQLLQHQVI